MTATIGRRRPTRAGALAPAAAGALTVGALVLAADRDDGVVLCPFRRCTGGYCPGCGATRAANRLVRGDVGAGWANHPWVVLAAVQVVVFGAVLAVTAPGARPVRARRSALPLLVANTVLLLAIWLVRRSTGAIPTGWL